jgi:hypothetical protein
MAILLCSLVALQRFLKRKRGRGGEKLVYFSCPALRAFRSLIDRNCSSAHQNGFPKKRWFIFTKKIQKKEEFFFFPLTSKIYDLLIHKLPLWRGMAHCCGDLPKSSRRPTCVTTRPPIPQLTTPTYLYLL